MPFRRANTIWDESSLYEYAVGALGRRMRSVAEMKRLLRQRVGQQPNGEALMDAVIARLKQHRYLNDAEYASAYAGLRKENDRFGRLRVISDLKSRGVHPQLIAGAVNAAYEGSSEEQLARLYLRKKRLRRPASAREAARIFRSLRRAGFSGRTIAGLLKRWKVDDELLESLQAADSLSEDDPEL